MDRHLPNRPWPRTFRVRALRVWRLLLRPLVYFLRKCREEYARRRRYVERGDEVVEIVSFRRDDTIWALRRWTQLMHWLTLRHGSAANHFRTTG